MAPSVPAAPAVHASAGSARVCDLRAVRRDALPAALTWHYGLCEKSPPELGLGPGSPEQPGPTAGGVGPKLDEGKPITRARVAREQAAGSRADAAKRLGQAARPSRLGRAFRRPLPRHLTLLCCYLAAGVTATWPRASYLVTGRLPSSRDSAGYVWDLWWVARQITHLGNPWFTDHMAAPAGVALGYHTLMPLPGALLTPLTLAFGPSAAYNLLVAVTPGLLSYAMYRAARLWLRSQAGAIAAGAFFGLSSMLAQEDWYHVNIAIGAIFLPVALEASVRLRRDPCLRTALVLGLAMGAAVLTDPESAVLAAILTLLVLLPWLVWRPSWAKLWPAAGAAAAGAVLASPQISAMAQEMAGPGHLGINPRLLAVTDKLYGIGLPGMFAPSPRVADFGLAALAGPFLHSRDNEGLPMFGVVLTALALAGLAAAWRRRGARLLALLWLGCAALALGGSLWIGNVQHLPLMQTWHGVRVSALLPYTWFVRIPGLSSFREADRLAILGLAPAALLAGAAVDWLRHHARPLIVVVAGLAVLEAGYSGTAKVGTMPTAMPALDHPIAADRSNSIVLDVPYGLRGGVPQFGARFASQALVLATADGRRRAVAYVSRLPKTTLDAAARHAFYADLIHTQHYTAPIQNRRPTVQIIRQLRPLWIGTPVTYIPLTARQVAAARRDAATLDIGWVIVWQANPAILRYLAQTGFHPSYRADGAVVYRPTRR